MLVLEVNGKYRVPSTFERIIQKMNVFFNDGTNILTLCFSFVLKKIIKFKSVI